MAWIVYLLSVAYSGSITDLDDDRFDKRELATRYLQEQWPLCVPSLYIKSNPSAEFTLRRSRINKESNLFWNILDREWLSSKIINCIHDDPKRMPNIEEMEMDQIAKLLQNHGIGRYLVDNHNFNFNYYRYENWKIWTTKSESDVKKELIDIARDKYQEIITESNKNNYQSK